MHWVVLNWYCNIFTILSKYVYNAAKVPFEKSKMASFTSLIMKNVVVFSPRSIFSAKLIFCIAFGSALSTCYLLKSIVMISCSLK